MTLAACGTVPVSKPATQAPTPNPPAAAAEAPKPQTVKAALLLPLSGPQAEIGQQLLNAAQMAVFDVAADDFELLPRDTKGTPQGAAMAARAALADGAKVILGPLFAPEVQAIKPIAQEAGVEVLSFSTNWTVAGGGTNILGFVPSDQVDRVTGYASSRGIRRFAGVAPRNEYGDAVANALQGVAQKLGGQVSDVERYDAGTPDFTLVAQAVVKATMPAQAILMADSADRARQFSAALTAAGMDLKQVKLLGTGLWDVPNLGQDPSMAGAWFAAADPARRAQFEKKFEATYSRKPQRIVTLAYDGTALAATLARLRGPAGLSHFDLVGDSGFEGLDGLFRLRENGIAQRGLAVLEVTPAGTRVLDPAPTTFENQGY